MHFAVLDLGTNTFHILIAKIEKKNTSIIYRDEQWVYLAEKGIETIAQSAIQRAEQVLKKYSQIINKYSCEISIAIGTAAFRKASNSDVLKEMANNLLGCEVNIIEGDKEAELIYKGVRWACKLADEKCLIMDIGGGSTEFIIANKNEIFWKKSFALGASVLKQKFHHHEPVLSEEIKEMKKYLKSQLEELSTEMQKHSIAKLIGASGSFDSFRDCLNREIIPVNEQQDNTELNKTELLLLFQELIKLDWDERKKYPGLVNFRAEMIVTASIITEYIIETFSIESISQSAYALKEGVLMELLDK